MSWDEVDLEEKVWTVQPSRMSSKIDRKDNAKRVPLTAEMIALLEGLPRQADGNLVFWAPRGGPLSDATMGKLMRTLHLADVKAGNKGLSMPRRKKSLSHTARVARSRIGRSRRHPTSGSFQKQRFGTSWVARLRHRLPERICSKSAER